MSDFKLKTIEDLKKSPNFCISPWIHLHLWPNGDALPCCMTPPNHVAGNVNNSSIKQLVNSNLMTSIRKDMMNDKPAPSCERCYELEKSGSGSLRTYFYHNFQQHYPQVFQTQQNGEIDNFKMRYVDIRFSNVCNFKCRTCGLSLSSGWYEDTLKLAPHTTEAKLQRIIDQSSDLMKQFDEFYDSIEEINFVGGEPMFTEEHWLILNELDQRKKYDVTLTYNTNFSTLTYKNFDAIELWKKFKKVEVKASLDGAHERGEYIRKGLRWSKIVENRERMLKLAPEIKFQINCTVSNMNVWHIVDFHREWVEKGYIDPVDMTLSLLLFPEHYRVQTLPNQFKIQVKQKLENYLNELDQKPYADRIFYFKERVQAIINFMMAEDREKQWSDFILKNGKLDELRSESALQTFPELEPYLHHVNEMTI